MGQAWLTDVRGWCAGDFTADGRVDVNDLNRIGLNWQQDVSGEAAAASVGRTPRAPLAAHAAARPVVDAAVEVGIASEVLLDRRSFISNARNVVRPTPMMVAHEAFRRANRSPIAPYQTAHSGAGSAGEPEAIENNEADLVDFLLANWHS